MPRINTGDWIENFLDFVARPPSQSPTEEEPDEYGEMAVPTIPLVESIADGTEIVYFYDERDAVSNAVSFEFPLPDKWFVPLGWSVRVNDNGATTGDLLFQFQRTLYDRNEFTEISTSSPVLISKIVDTAIAINYFDSDPDIYTVHAARNFATPNVADGFEGQGFVDAKLPPKPPAMEWGFNYDNTYDADPDVRVSGYGLVSERRAAINAFSST